MRNRWRWTLAVMGLAALSYAGTTDKMAAQSDVGNAIAVLHPTEGHKVAGTVRFTAVPEGVRVHVRLEGLTPGEHGFHIHELGDCSKADGTSAGGHYNPTGAPHAGREAKVRHVGDLGNVTANAAGVVDTEFVDSVIALHGPHSIIGRGVIVHAGRDDLTSQPSGAAGARVACGVVGITESKN